jgi:hypothetical protein
VQSTFDIDEGETALTLNTKCFGPGIASFAELIGLIETGAIEGVLGHLVTARTIRHDRPDAAATLDSRPRRPGRSRQHVPSGQGYVNHWRCRRSGQSWCLFFLALEEAEAITRDPPGTVCASGEDGAYLDGGWAVRIKALVDTAGTLVEPARVLPPGESIVPLTGEEFVALRAFTTETARQEAWFVKRLHAGGAPEVYGSLPRSKEQMPNIRSFLLPALSGQTEQGAIAAIAGYFIRSSTLTPSRYINDNFAADVRALLDTSHQLSHSF